MIIGDSGSGKTKALLNLINEQDNIDKIYLYAKHLNEPKYEFSIKKREEATTKHLNDPNAFIECSNTMNEFYENIYPYNQSRKGKVLIVFADMIAEIMSNKKLQAILKELFIRCRKLNISLVFITQSYFSVPKNVRLYSTHYLIMKINNKKELQNIAINHSAGIDYNDFLNIYREYASKSYSFLTIDTTLPASDPPKFRKVFFLLTKMTVTDQLKINVNKNCCSEKKSAKKAYFRKVTGKGFVNNKEFWNTVKPFLTNEGFLKNETIAIENKGKIVTDKSKLVNLFNSHYINIVEKRQVVLQKLSVILKKKLMA